MPLNIAFLSPPGLLRCRPAERRMLGTGGKTVFRKSPKVAEKVRRQKAQMGHAGLLRPKGWACRGRHARWCGKGRDY
ncbi:hypothetical protein EMIT0196P_210016 [Pseudomonas chlororaphis]